MVSGANQPISRKNYRAIPRYEPPARRGDPSRRAAKPPAALGRQDGHHHRRHPWTITWALAAGRPEPIGILSDGTRTVAGFPMEMAGKLGPLIAAALRQQARCLASFGETARARQLRRWADAAERPPGRQQYNRELLRKVTETYNLAVERGDYPARAVHDALPGHSPAQLNRYIRRARDFGDIPPYQRRKTD